MAKTKLNGVFFMTANDTFQADIIESKLKAFGIPVVRKYRETGAYLTLFLGKSSFGVDLYVPEERLEEAKDIMASDDTLRDEDILEDPSFRDESIKNQNQQLINKMDRQTWIMAGLFFLAMAILLYFVFRTL